MIATSHNNEDDNIHSLDIYREYFEDRFLLDTKDFYRSKAMDYLEIHSVMEYLAKV
jgi:hypothetical protein